MPHQIASRDEWLAARKELLQAEKDLTRRSDELARRRQELPWVRIDKHYQFATDEGNASLADLFRSRSQLLVYHFMFGPDYAAGCPSCSAIADGFNGITAHLANHDVMLWAVSRAPLAKLQDYKRRMGWTFPWASSHGSDFNADFGVFFTDDQQRAGDVEYNYRREPPMQLAGHNEEPSGTVPILRSLRSKMGLSPSPRRFSEKLIAGHDEPDISRNTPDGPAKAAAMAGTDVATFTRERPGMSAFVLDRGAVHHTYSAYARGLDALWNAYQWLDRAPKGRNESGYWWHRHDEYEQPSQTAGSCCHNG
jgi:predicted dithiol-disulfide oxidoreductase (DUF899 family)